MKTPKISYPLRKITELVEASYSLYGTKKVKLECGHVVRCSSGAIHRARCKACLSLTDRPQSDDIHHMKTQPNPIPAVPAAPDTQKPRITLTFLAQQYGLTVEDVMRRNNCAREQVIVEEVPQS